MRLGDADVAARSSFWLHQALAGDRDLAEPLEGEVSADTCIVGGGYMGLWAAIMLADAGQSVVLIERDICGGGASGRNSGMALPAWSKIAALLALGGTEGAVEVVRASGAAITAIDAFCAAEGIDAWFERRGWLWAASCSAQDGAWDESIALHEHLDLPPPARRVARDEIAALTGSTAFVGGVLDDSAATVHPGFLARGLRRAALRRGVRIFERTAMTGFARRGAPVVTTPRGRVQAGHLVLAMNAWSAGVRHLAPAIFNIASDDGVSKPIPEELARTGLQGGPLVIDSRVFVGGWRATRDGRLNVGVTGGIIGFGGRVDARFDAPSRREADMRALMQAEHPALAAFPLERAWCGAIDRTASGLPLFGALPGNPHILYGYGFSGNGITMTHVGARLLASLILDRDDPLRDSALLRPVTRGFPPEPIRFPGAHLVRGAVRARDRAEHADRRPGVLVRLLAGLAPSGVTPSQANIRRKE
ncbi:MAG: FAD-dependent oxidoreductase [Rubellimicrobium sp.]|nr:FAD-dependent oxidoreductase [Rubellimicrobium sp.]